MATRKGPGEWHVGHLEIHTRPYELHTVAGVFTGSLQWLVIDGERWQNDHLVEHVDINSRRPTPHPSSGDDGMRVQPYAAIVRANFVAHGRVVFLADRVSHVDHQTTLTAEDVKATSDPTHSAS